MPGFPAMKDYEHATQRNESVCEPLSTNLFGWYDQNEMENRVCGMRLTWGTKAS
jgi:hypothetical protein